MLRGAPWRIAVFSLGMFLVVYGRRTAGLTGDLVSALVWLHVPLAALLALAGSLPVLPAP